MKMRYLALAFIPAMALAVATNASAHGFFGAFKGMTPEEKAEHKQEMMATKAEILGVEVEVLEQAREDGVRRGELIEQLGLDKEEVRQRFKQAKIEHMQERLDHLVSEGELTQDEADQKMEKMQEHMEHGKHGHKKHRRHHHHMPPEVQ